MSSHSWRYRHRRDQVSPRHGCVLFAIVAYTVDCLPGVLAIDSTRKRPRLDSRVEATPRGALIRQDPSQDIRQSVMAPDWSVASQGSQVATSMATDIQAPQTLTGLIPISSNMASCRAPDDNNKCEARQNIDPYPMYAAQSATLCCPAVDASTCILQSSNTCVVPYPNEATAPSDTNVPKTKLCCPDPVPGIPPAAIPGTPQGPMEAQPINGLCDDFGGKCPATLPFQITDVQSTRQMCCVTAYLALSNQMCIPKVPLQTCPTASGTLQETFLAKNKDQKEFCCPNCIKLPQTSQCGGDYQKEFRSGNGPELFCCNKDPNNDPNARTSGFDPGASITNNPMPGAPASNGQSDAITSGSCVALGGAAGCNIAPRTFLMRDPQTGQQICCSRAIARGSCVAPSAAGCTTVPFTSPTTDTETRLQICCDPNAVANGLNAGASNGINPTVIGNTMQGAQAINGQGSNANSASSGTLPSQQTQQAQPQPPMQAQPQQAQQAQAQQAQQAQSQQPLQAQPQQVQQAQPQQPLQAQPQQVQQAQPASRQQPLNAATSTPSPTPQPPPANDIPVGHVISVLGGAIAVIMLPAVYVLIAGKSKPGGKSEVSSGDKSAPKAVDSEVSPETPLKDN